MFLENLAYKESIKVIQKELTNTQSSLARSKSTVGESDCIGKELSLALSLMENKVQAKKRELAYILNSEKELQAHISDIDCNSQAAGPLRWWRTWHEHTPDKQGTVREISGALRAHEEKGNYLQGVLTGEAGTGD